MVTLPALPMLDAIGALLQSRSCTLSIVIVPVPESSALATSTVNSVPLSAVVPQGWPSVTPSAANWPPPRSRICRFACAPSEPRNPPIWMLALPDGSDRFAERVNVTLKPSMLVALERVIVTGNVAVACAFDSTLDAAPTLTTAWAEAVLSNAKNPASANRNARTRGPRQTSKTAAMGTPRNGGGGGTPRRDARTPIAG